jgi:exosortase A-associated hydrolase 2
VTPNKRAVGAHPFYLSSSAGKLFALYFPPIGVRTPKRAVLYFPPFAEETNKARRMAVLQARRLANLGHATLLIDLFGTGDSEGDFAETRWEIWREDLVKAANWLSQQGAERLVFWGLRLGAFFAVELATTARWQVERLLLWQPVTRGEMFMTQFLRLRIAADIVSKQDRLTTQQLRDGLNRGLPLEVAGYTLAPEMFGAVDGLDMQSTMCGKLPSVDWMEIATDAVRPVSAAGQRVLDTWRADGVSATSHVVAGEPFWYTPEITIVPALLEITSSLLADPAT